MWPHVHPVHCHVHEWPLQMISSNKTVTIFRDGDRGAISRGCYTSIGMIKNQNEMEENTCLILKFQSSDSLSGKMCIFKLQHACASWLFGPKISCVVVADLCYVSHQQFRLQVLKSSYTIYIRTCVVLWIFGLIKIYDFTFDSSIQGSSIPKYCSLSWCRHSGCLALKMCQWFLTKSCFNNSIYMFPSWI